jgi:hypothetical protein
MFACSSVVSRRTAAVALRWRRLAWGDMTVGSFGRCAFGWRGELFTCFLHGAESARGPSSRPHWVP